jgi:membrane glycosyltransferase
MAPVLGSTLVLVSVLLMDPVLGSLWAPVLVTVWAQVLVSVLVLGSVLVWDSPTRSPCALSCRYN